VNGDGFADVLLGAESGGTGGTASIYLGGASGLSATPAATRAGPGGVGASFGESVASAGDVNGDGFVDLIVGAKRDPNKNGVEVGAAYLYFGSASGFGASPGASVKLQGQGGYFGASVASAGDVNGDGYADVVVGAPNDASAYVFLGGPNLASSLSIGNGQTITGAAGSSFGFSVAGIGDVNGDGLGDVVVGAPETASGQGAALIYLGSAAGLSLFGAPITGTGELGYSVASAGDVNGDGYNDVVIGALGGGLAYVYEGGATTADVHALVATPAAPIGTGADEFGASVAGAGDVNGDGYSDVVIAAWSNRTAYVYEGSADGLLPTARATIAAPGDASGGSVASVAGVADVNGDGFSDVVVEASSWASSTSGEADLHLGSVDGLASAAAATYVGDDGAELGSSAY
jgi:hypothetical protein